GRRQSILRLNKTTRRLSLSRGRLPKLSSKSKLLLLLNLSIIVRFYTEASTSAARRPAARRSVRDRSFHRLPLRPVRKNGLSRPSRPLREESQFHPWSPFLRPSVWSNRSDKAH